MPDFCCFCDKSEEFRGGCRGVDNEKAYIVNTYITNLHGNLWVKCCICNTSFHTNCASKFSGLDKFYEYEFTRRPIDFNCCSPITSPDISPHIRIANACFLIKCNASVVGFNCPPIFPAGKNAIKAKARLIWNDFMTSTQNTVLRFHRFRIFRQFRESNTLLYKETLRPKSLKKIARDAIRDYIAALTFMQGDFIRPLQQVVRGCGIPLELMDYIVEDSCNEENLHLLNK